MTDQNVENRVLRPYTYLKNNTSGKGFRSDLLSVINLHYKVSKDDLTIVQEFIDILHTSSLLVDDVEDNGETRRGKLCAHRVYGIASTINAGNLMYFKAWEKLMELQNEKLNGIFVQSMIKLHLGQGKEIYWRDNMICPTEEEYLEMVAGKTGELFKLGVLILHCISEKNSNPLSDEMHEKLLKFSELLGMIYQIKNDLNDIEEDFATGSYSYPLIYCVREKNMEWRGSIPVCASSGSQKIKQSEIVRVVKDLGGVLHSHTKLKHLIDVLESVLSGDNEVEHKLLQLVKQKV